MAVATRAQKRYLLRRARQLGLDPKAVKSIALHEGWSGGIGDGGHAFGPFQMNNAGGVLTGRFAGWSPDQINQWAWSKQGIDKALKSIAGVARGLKGKAAIRAIATKYERPADPASEISDAWSRYQKMGSFKGLLKKGQGFGGGKGVQIVRAGAKTVTKFDSDTYRKQAAAVLMQGAMASATGDNSVQMSVPSTLQQLRKANTHTMRVPQYRRELRGGGQGHGGGSARGAEAVSMAAKQIGQPYVWGGESRKEGGFDCSGLVQWAYGAMGIKLPRVAADQGRAGRAVSYKHLKKGDLLVAKDGHHVVMYAGHGRVIAAPHTGTVVQYQPLSYFPPSQYKARRIVG